MQAGRSIITLTSDFGLADSYVAALKAAVLGVCPDVRLVDVTHLIRPQDILGGAIALERAVAAFGAGTIHLAVVDPGVGTRRRILVVEIAGQVVICPDNGLITWAWRRHGGRRRRVWELTWRPPRSELSRTFHGRDIMAPAAGLLASGKHVSALARPMGKPVLLDVAPASSRASSGTIIHIDHFGNATTNIPVEAVRRRATRHVLAENVDVGVLKGTYREVPRGSPLALIGSSGLLEIAVRDGSAAEQLGLRVGDRVHLREA